MAQSNYWGICILPFLSIGTPVRLKKNDTYIVVLLTRSLIARGTNVSDKLRKLSFSNGNPRINFASKFIIGFEDISR